MEMHKIVTHKQWIAARKSFLRKEKAFTRKRDHLSAQRRALPWEKVETIYTFHASRGNVTLHDLFENHPQLIVYHFMFGHDWEEGCPGCSYLADHFDGMLPHLHARNTAFSVISHAPLEKILPFKDRMGWHFPWVSSFGSAFNHDFNVSFSREEMQAGKVYYNYEKQEFPSEEAPGLSVFFKNKDGEIFHTYSTYGRGLDILVGTYNYLDLTPLGRDEAKLERPMQWLRHHDRYDTPAAAA